MDVDTHHTCSDQLILSIIPVHKVDCTEPRHVMNFYCSKKLVEEDEFELRCNDEVQTVFVGECNSCD